MTELLEPLGRLLGRSHRLRVDRHIGDDRLGEQSDAQCPDRSPGGRQESGRRRRRVERVPREFPGHDIEQRGGVRHRTGDRTARHKVADRVADGAVAHAPAARLDPHEPVRRCRDPDRPTTVGAVRDRGQPGCDSHRRTAGRSSRGAARIPDAACRRAHLRFGFGVAGKTELRRRRLAGEHQSRLTHGLNDVVILVGRQIEHRRAHPRVRTDHEVQILHRAHDAEQGAVRLAGRHRGVGCACLLDGDIRREHHVGAGHTLPPAQVVLGEFDRRDLT